MPYFHTFVLTAFIIGVSSGCSQTRALYTPSEEAPRPPVASAEDAVHKKRVR